MTKNDAVDKEESAFLATLKGKNRETDRVLSFEKGPLAGLVRFEFAAMGKDKVVQSKNDMMLTSVRLVVRRGPADLRAPKGPIQAY